VPAAELTAPTAPASPSCPAQGPNGRQGRQGWLDLGCGAAGDMLLGALLGAGAPLVAVQEAVGSLGLPVDVVAETVLLGGLAATRVQVVSAEAHPPHRTWSDVRALLDAAARDAALDAAVADRAGAVFAALAGAEGRVHGVDADDVHFHEVGAHDAVGDIVGVCAAVAALGLTHITATPVALGGGTARTAHGLLPVPVPAVLELLRGVPVHGGPADVELCTPTGAALLAVLVDDWGPLPALRVEAVGMGAGTRELAGRPNVVRLVVGA